MMKFSPLRPGMTDQKDDEHLEEEEQEEQEDEDKEGEDEEDYDSYNDYDYDDYDEDDVFHIPPKPSIEMLKKWRKATLALNACRRFRYTLDLQSAKELKNGELVSRFRTATHALRALHRFKVAGARISEAPPEGFLIGPEQLVLIMQEAQLDLLEQRGGIKGIATALRSDVEGGIDPENVDRRKDAYGSNYIPRKEGKSFWTFAWEACHDTTLIILMACGALSLATGMWTDGPKEGWYDGTSIAVAVILVILVTAVSDYKQSLQFRSLNDVKQNIQIEVVRGARRMKVSIFDIVVGDVVSINIGDQIPADGLLITGHSLSIDESSMTGESMPVCKDSKHPFLMSGCKVSDGFGTFLVVAVGRNTEWGQVMLTLSEDSGEETPLQVRLNGAATFIGQIGLSVAVLVFFIIFVRYFATDFRTDNPKASKVIKEVVNIFSIAVTIIVVAVPEGLPLAVTLTLAYSMRKMMADKSLVRHLAACETMGSATTICSDKTGTLTLNQMSVVKSWVCGHIMEVDDVKKIPPSTYNTLLIGVCHNSNGSVYTPKDGGEPEVSGSPTEAAALSWGVKIGMNYDSVKVESEIVQVETFNSTKKRAGVAVKLENGDIEVHWKGAAEMILELSNTWIDRNGTAQEMTEESREGLKRTIEGMAAASLRCIAFAYKPVDGSTVPVSEEELKEWKIPHTDLIFLALVGLKDPCRPGVAEAVAKCQAAGVKISVRTSVLVHVLSTHAGLCLNSQPHRKVTSTMPDPTQVRMVTGDSLLTAAAIAQECGIRTSNGIVVEGKVFREWSAEEMTENLPKVDVIARSSPTDKLLLVKNLKHRGEVVAVTGDGTNDAPALHEADVGLSMGISGTEVAKESSDIVILDDDFASVVKVVRWGRSVYANIQKFIQFQLTVNVGALAINFVAAVSSGEVPLTPVQLLWVNLIMDTLGALALATEPPTDDLMLQTPVGRREPLITNIMWRNIFFQASYQIVVLLTLNFGGESLLKLTGDKDHKKRVLNTIIFNAFVFCQLFNEVNARKPVKKNIFAGLFSNRLFIAIVGSSVILQFIIVEYLNKFASTTKISWQQWIICIVIGFISWPIAFIGKFVPVRRKPYINTRMLRRVKRRTLNIDSVGSSRAKSTGGGDVTSSKSSKKGKSKSWSKKSSAKGMNGEGTEKLTSHGTSSTNKINVTIN